MEELFKHITLGIASVVELLAALLIALAVLKATLQAMATYFGLPMGRPKQEIRLNLGRWLMLSLEFTLAADIVATVVASGLLSKSSAVDDQRRCVLVLTDVGRKELAAVTYRRRDLVAETVADWPDTDVSRALVADQRAEISRLRAELEAWERSRVARWSRPVRSASARARRLAGRLRS